MRPAAPGLQGVVGRGELLDSIGRQPVSGGQGGHACLPACLQSTGIAGMCRLVPLLAGEADRITWLPPPQHHHHMHQQHAGCDSPRLQVCVRTLFIGMPARGRSCGCAVRSRAAAWGRCCCRTPAAGGAVPLAARWPHRRKGSSAQLLISCLNSCLHRCLGDMRSLRMGSGARGTSAVRQRQRPIPYGSGSAAPPDYSGSPVLNRDPRGLATLLLHDLVEVAGQRLSIRATQLK